MSLPLRWTPLRPHAEQIAYFESPHRFNVVPAGRRSGKTELAKRKLIMRALYGSEFRKPRYFAAAPTRDQAKRIYWDDLCALMPPRDVKDIRATDLLIRLRTGAEIVIVGMDRPERIEGSPWDGGILDEFANMKPNAWQANIRPALADRNGWCDLIGVPEGRNHYFDTYQRAVTSMETFGAASEWGAYTWKSATVLSAHEIASAKADLDERTFRQEYEASFETYSGVVIYAFDRALSVKPCPMRPGVPLHVGMDFNVNPMSATVWQEEGEITRQVGEVVIPTSNTDDMCDELARRYSINGSVGHITVYPDPAGVQRRTSAQGRTDISILRDRKFGVRAMSSHPLVRDRINITNSRFCTVDGTRRAFVDSSCRKSIECYEKLSYREGTSEPDKSSGFSHIVDATGYYLYTRWGIGPSSVSPLRL